MHVAVPPIEFACGEHKVPLVKAAPPVIGAVMF